jgi:hypothetical protein
MMLRKTAISSFNFAQLLHSLSGAPSFYLFSTTVEGEAEDSSPIYILYV